jgi:hypothetical protein
MQRLRQPDAAALATPPALKLQPTPT